MQARILTVLFFVALISGSCTGTDKSVTYQTIGNDTLYQCDASKINRIETIRLSEWISDFQIVRFEDSDTALFKFWKVYITEHYIGILQNAQYPFKLFNHQGKFICDVGSIGQGPGEYTMLYSAAIDERTNTVCLAPFSGDKLLKYTMSGDFVCPVSIGKMQKPQIRFETDGSISLVHLCFRGMTGFQYARIDNDNRVSYILPNKSHAVDARDKNGNFVGFNHEIWFYNNTADFTYMTTAIDTLYKFNPQNGQTVPRFTMTNHAGYYCIYNEFPSCFIINTGPVANDGLWKPESNIVVIDKQSKQSYYAKVINDKAGHMRIDDLPYSNNGWYHEMFEPYQLIEKIQTHLKENKCSEEDRKMLEELKNSIDEDGNNIMFMGKIKK
jgi:hypothetical protein